MRIPTLLGIVLLLIILILGVLIFYYRQQRIIQARVFFTPKDIRIDNITDYSAAIIWQTDNPATSQILSGVSQSTLNTVQNDDRDKSQARPRLTHFVTLKNLQPNTKYFYRIKTGQFIFPNQALEFKTGSTISTSGLADQKSSLYPPIRGTVLDINVEPIDEALVFLKITGAAELATFTATAGNFLIPLTDLYRTDLAGTFNLADNTEATLTIIKGTNQSQVNIILPLEKTSIPAIQLGQNLNLQDVLKTSVSKTKQTLLGKFDLNGDGKINSIDISLILDNFGKNPKGNRADLDNNGVIDQKDIDLLKPFLQ